MLSIRRDQVTRIRLVGVPEHVLKGSKE
jgi:hypothetical protein